VVGGGVTACAANTVQDRPSTSLARETSRSVASGATGWWYQCSCGENSPQSWHWVIGHFTAQPGQTPRVQNVFQLVPQDGTQNHRSSALGFQAHFGQWISARSCGTACTPRFGFALGRTRLALQPRHDDRRNQADRQDNGNHSEHQYGFGLEVFHKGQCGQTRNATSPSPPETRYRCARRHHRA
jgi:hypothetical protein